MPLDVPQIADPLAVAEGFAAEVAARVAETEAARQVPQDLAERLAATGLYQLCVPKDLGGPGGSAADYGRVVERLARADASVGWCVFIGVTSAMTIAALPDGPAMLADRTALAAGVFAPTGTAKREAGGLRVNGRWQWGSGSPNARWISGGAMLATDDGSPPQQLQVVFHRDEIEILDTWHVSGLRGTGSNDFKAVDVLVPDTRALPVFGPRPDLPAFRFPTFGMLAIGIGAVALGLARTAIDEAVAVAVAKTPQGNSRSLAQKPRAHLEVARAEATLRAARLFFYQAIDDAWAAANGPDRPTLEQRRDLRLAITYAVEASVRAVDAMYTLCGGSSVYAHSPLQRCFRDVHVATQHMMVNDAVYELAGRLFLGLETSVAQL